MVAQSTFCLTSRKKIRYLNENIESDHEGVVNPLFAQYLQKEYIKMIFFMWMNYCFSSGFIKCSNYHITWMFMRVFILLKSHILANVVIKVASKNSIWSMKWLSLLRNQNQAWFIQVLLCKQADNVSPFANRQTILAPLQTGG